MRLEGRRQVAYMHCLRIHAGHDRRRRRRAQGRETLPTELLASACGPSPEHREACVSHRQHQLHRGPKEGGHCCRWAPGFPS